MRGVDLETISLDRAFSVVYALYVDEIAGPLGDRDKARRFLDSELERIDALVAPNTWGESAAAQQGMEGMLALANRSKGAKS